MSCGPAAGVGGAVAGLDQAHEQAPGEHLVGGVERVNGPVGGGGDGALHAAGRRVALEGEGAAVAHLPRGAQRMGQQRQRARLAGHLGHEQVDETGLDAQAGPGRRLGDGPPELGRRHRAEQHLVAGNRGGQAGVLGAGAVEVGPQPDHDEVRPRQQAVEERRALVVAAPWVNSSSNWSTTTGPSIASSAASGCAPGVMTSADAELRRHAGAQDGRLAAARRADDGEERVQRRRRSTRSATTSSRPKKRSASSQ